MADDIVERLRGYYTMFAGKPHFSNKLKVHKAADLHEAANEIDRLRSALKEREEALAALVAKIDALADGQCGPFAIRNSVANSAEMDAARATARVTPNPHSHSSNQRTITNGQQA